MNQFKNLILWQKSIELAEKIYKLSENLPVKERYNLTSQINRSAVSIPTNIAEGSGRNSDREFNYFLGIANGSTFELETQIIICMRLNYFQKEEVEETNKLIIEIQKMIYALQRNLKKDETNNKNNTANAPF
jgi:four helix bundle protein